MVKINNMIVSKSIQNRLTYGGRNPVKYIMVHQTANTSKGANAYMHAKLQANGNSRQASWHFSVDANNIYQSFPDTAQAWHAGNRTYNQNSIGIELCVNSDGDYNGTVENGAKLVKHLMNKHNVPISRVIRHKDASGKYCPRELLNGKNGITWAKFKDMVQGEKVPSKPSKPSKPSTSSGGGSIVDYLNKQGKNSSFSARKKLATKHGIKNYKGTAKQNTTLLSKLKSGSKPSTSKPSKPKKTINQMAQEVRAGKYGTGHANRRKSLGISQSEYNKVRAEVNRLEGVSSAPKSTFNANNIAQQIKKGIDNKGRRIPNGHSARRKHFGLTNAQYQQVRSIVNRIM